MTRTLHRATRLVAAATATALLLPVGAASAQDATTDPTADAATWLVDQLVDGDHLEGEFGAQYGPTADVAYGLLTTGQEPDALADVLAFLSRPESVDAYVHGGDFDGNIVEDPTYAGANAKLGFLAATAGLDPRDVGGDDLVENMESLLTEDGRYSDRSDHGDFSNVFGQSFALLFLTAADEVEAPQEAVDFLAAAQCDDGGFPEGFDAEECTSSVDATALAVQALATLPAEDPAVVDPAIAYLVGARDADGAYEGAGGQNVNSTGYAGMALEAVAVDATPSRAFLLANQNEDGGLPINPGGDSDAFATAQALPLLGRAAFVDLVDGIGYLARLAGTDRFLTAIDVSQATYADDAADTVILARGDLFADALAGTALAVATNGPLLTTSHSGLLDVVLAEIDRVLPDGATVHVLGGVAALPASVNEDLEAAGYEVVRLGGTDRYETAVEIAAKLDTPTQVLLTTGLDFADALTAGTAASAHGGVVMLTRGDQPVNVVTEYLATVDAPQVAVGGPAAAAYPEAEALVGTGREETAALVAERFFPEPRVIGIARRNDAADSLAGGVHVGRLGGPLLLTFTDELPTATAEYLCPAGPGLRAAFLFGGEAAISASVADIVEGSLQEPCAIPTE